MTPVYDYRVVCQHGHTVHCPVPIEAKHQRDRLNNPTTGRVDCKPWRIQRRPNVAWEDAT